MQAAHVTDLDVSALALTGLLPVHAPLSGLACWPQPRVTAAHTPSVLLHLDTGALLEHVTVTHIVIIVIIIMIMPHLVTAPRPQPALGQHHRDWPPPLCHRDTGPRSEARVTATLTPEHLHAGHVLICSEPQ